MLFSVCRVCRGSYAVHQVHHMLSSVTHGASRWSVVVVATPTRFTLKVINRALPSSAPRSVCRLSRCTPAPQRRPSAQLGAQPIAAPSSVGICQHFTVSTFCSSMLYSLHMLKRQFLFSVAYLGRCTTATSSGSRTFSMNPSRFHAAQDMAMQW